MDNVTRAVFGFFALSLIFTMTIEADLRYNNRNSPQSCLQRRSPAPADSPTGSYAPSVVQCPPGLRVRVADQYPWPISPGEDTYISEKSARSIPLWEQYLSQARLENFNISRFLQSARQKGGLAGETLPNIAFAVSGGGARAMLYGASILDAFDNRNPQAVKAQTGGVMQLANYLTGLSGGAWLVTSWATAGFERMTTMNQTVWSFAKRSSWKSLKQFPKFYRQIKKKKKAGFEVSFVDLWGRMLSEHFIDDPGEGEKVLFSSIRNTTAYKNHSFPFPIIVAVSRRGMGEQITPRTPIYEFTPEDFNAWHPSFNGSIPLEFLGSKTASGTGSANPCVKGFDNAGFLMASSSNVFSLHDDSSHKRAIWDKLFRLFVKGSFYEALIPNPFQGQNRGVTPGSGFDDADHETLLLGDGDLARENLPVFPLLQPSRKVDVIIAVDATLNTAASQETDPNGYPNGTALYNTFTKLQQPEFRNYLFPRIPNAYNSSFTSKGYNKRPTFFGCDMKKGPLVIYLPNYFVTDKTDMRTRKASYTGKEIDGFFRNSFFIATQTNFTANDREWPACFACALLDRQQKRALEDKTPQCELCFKKYCA